MLLVSVQAAAHPPSTGPGAVGWRVQLYWPADGAWHEGEVLSYNEVSKEADFFLFGLLVTAGMAVGFVFSFA